MNYSLIIFGIKNHGPGLQVLWTGSSAGAIRAHHGPTASGGQRLIRASAREQSRPRELATRGPRGRREWIGPHRGRRGRWTAGGEPTMEGNRWAMTELDGRAIRVRMERADVRNGKVVWRQCSRLPFIGRGRREVSG
jgi:hypothetical protein